MKPGNNFTIIDKIMPYTIITLFVIILAFNAVFTVKEQEQAVLITFGNVSTISDPGLHFKIPFIQKVRKVDTTTKGLTIGYVEATGHKVEDESLMITSDYNFVNVDFYVEYKVSDPILALYASENPVAILKNITQSSIRTVIGGTDVDSVLTSGKYEIQTNIRDMITVKLEKNDIGLHLVNISIQDAEPPTEEVMEAFKAVETAKQAKETAINNANRYRNEKLPAATAQADKILQQAAAAKQERINEATGQVARFNQIYAEYTKFKDVTKKRMFYEAMEEILPSLEVIIDSGDGSVQKLYPLNSFADFGSGNSNQSEATKEEDE